MPGNFRVVTSLGAPCALLARTWIPPPSSAKPNDVSPCPNRLVSAMLL
jgi:hypothetical protein